LALALASIDTSGQQQKLSASRKWWASRESNTAPTDSGLCDFRHSLDFAFTLSVRLRWVPSSLYTFNDAQASKLGSALPYA